MIYEVTPDLAMVIIINSIIYTERTPGAENNWPDDTKLVRYINRMSSGNWTFQSSYISISLTGAMQDGHHRIMAVYKSGITQIFNFRYTCDFMALYERNKERHPKSIERISKMLISS